MSIQDKFNRANVIYKITKDIDLGGETLTIPEGCTLDFQGGSFKNGNVKGNNTVLISNNTVVFDNINIIGTWECYYITDKMFLYKEENAENNTQILTNLFSLSSDNVNNNITISRKYKYIPIFNSGLLVKSNTTISGGGEIYAEPCSYNYAQLFRVDNAENVIIENLKLVGDVQSRLDSTGEWNYGIYLRGSKNCIIRNCDISEFWGDGINIQKSEYMTEASANEIDYKYHCKNIIIEDCILYKNRRNNISIEAVIDIAIDNCKILDAGTINGTSPKIGIDIEPIPDNYQIAKDIRISNCYFNGNIGKDIAVPAAMTYGYLIIDNCELNSFSAWSASSELDIIIRNSKIKGEEIDNIHTPKRLIIENSFIAHNLRASSGDLYINNCDVPSLSITSNKGEISNSNIGHFDPQGSHDLIINNCNCNQFYVHRNISDITVRDCNLVGESIIMFNGSVEVNNVVFENCKLENIGGENPFIGVNYVPSNCLMKNCTLKVEYTGEIWIPFDNFIDCNITANSIKTIHNNAYFENCNITTNNPIKLLDIDNTSLIEYVFKNTNIYTSEAYITKSSNNYSTFVEVIDGNIDIGKVRNIKLSENSIINNRMRLLSNYYKFDGRVNTTSTTYAAVVIPKVYIGWLKMKLTGSNRFQTVELDEEINISIYSSSIKASIKFNGSTINIANYNKLIYPKLHITDDNYYIVFECVNGKNADINMVAEIYSKDAFNSQFIDVVYLNKSDVVLTEISTDVANIIKDSLSNLKGINKLNSLNLINGYSTDYNKPLWHNGTTWVDATGTTV